MTSKLNRGRGAPAALILRAEDALRTQKLRAIMLADELDCSRQTAVRLLAVLKKYRPVQEERRGLERWYWI